MIRAQVAIGNLEPDLLAVLCGWQCEIRQKIKFRAVASFFVRAAGVEHVVDQHPIVLISRHILLGIRISRHEIEVVSQHAGLEEVHDLFREFNVTFSFSFVVLRMIQLKRKNVPLQSLSSHPRLGLP